MIGIKLVANWEQNFLKVSKMPVEKRCLYQQKISPILGKIFKYI